LIKEVIRTVAMPQINKLLGLFPPEALPQCREEVARKWPRESPFPFQFSALLAPNIFCGKQRFSALCRGERRSPEGRTQFGLTRRFRLRWLAALRLGVSVVKSRNSFTAFAGPAAATNNA